MNFLVTPSEMDIAPDGTTASCAPSSAGVAETRTVLTVDSTSYSSRISSYLSSLMKMLFKLVS
ncbi:MAG: hypothetical protein K2H09_09945, partial [Treponemataceae bacterium]|nr:hypothetical protein [Treponemataceae bacterium]